MKKVLILPFMLAIYLPCFSQLFNVGKGKSVDEARNRILLVRTYEKGDPTLRDFADDENIVASQNEMLKAVFSKHWKLNQQVEYVTKDEMNKRVSSNPEKYALVKRFWGEDVMLGAKINRSFDIYKVNYILPQGKKSETLFSMAFPSSALGELDYRFFVSQCNEYLLALDKGIKPKDKEIWNPDENIAAIEKGTLFLLEDQYTDDQSEVRESYCGNVEFLPSNELYNKVTSEQTGAMFMTVVWSYKKKFYAYVLVDANTYDMLGIIGMGGIEINIGIPLGDPEMFVGDAPLFSLPLYGDMGIHASHFKYVCKGFAQKVNY